MEQPPGFVMDSTLVCQLNKSLYGLKQDPQSWYDKIDILFLRLDLKHSEIDNNVYVLHRNEDTLIFIVYVDDILITGNYNDLILRLKKHLDDSFDMKDLGTLHYFLGLQVLPLCDVFFYFSI